MVRLVLDARRRQSLGAVALFVALGGTSYAVALDRASVGSRELRNGSVRTVDIRDRAVTSQKIASGAVKSRQIAANAVTPSRIAPGRSTATTWRTARFWPRTFTAGRFRRATRAIPAHRESRGNGRYGRHRFRRLA
jgi:hypothetical protein